MSNFVVINHPNVQEPTTFCQILMIKDLQTVERGHLIKIGDIYLHITGTGQCF